VTSTSITKTPVVEVDGESIDVSVYGSTGNVYLTATGVFVPFTHDPSRGFFHIDLDDPNDLDGIILRLMEARVRALANRAAWDAKQKQAEKESAA